MIRFKYYLREVEITTTVDGIITTIIDLIRDNEIITITCLVEYTITSTVINLVNRTWYIIPNMAKYDIQSAAENKLIGKITFF